MPGCCADARAVASRVRMLGGFPNPALRGVRTGQVSPYVSPIPARTGPLGRPRDPSSVFKTSPFTPVPAPVERFVPTPQTTQTPHRVLARSRVKTALPGQPPQAAVPLFIAIDDRDRAGQVYVPTGVEVDTYGVEREGSTYARLDDGGAYRLPGRYTFVRYFGAVCRPGPPGSAPICDQPQVGEHWGWVLSYMLDTLLGPFNRPTGTGQVDRPGPDVYPPDRTGPDPNPVPLPATSTPSMPTEPSTPSMPSAPADRRDLVTTRATRLRYGRGRAQPLAAGTRVRAHHRVGEEILVTVLGQPSLRGLVPRRDLAPASGATTGQAAPPNVPAPTCAGTTLADLRTAIRCGKDPDLVRVLYDDLLHETVSRGLPQPPTLAGVYAQEGMAAMPIPRTIAGSIASALVVDPAGTFLLEGPNVQYSVLERLPAGARLYIRDMQPSPDGQDVWLRGYTEGRREGYALARAFRLEQADR